MQYKIVKTLFICLFLPIICFGQLNEFAPLDSKWKFFFDGAENVPNQTYEIFVEGDTLIQNKQCNIINADEIVYSENSLTEIVYSENNKVYIYRDSSFHLLFDFDAEVGDTVVVFEDNFLPFFHQSWDTAYLESFDYFAYVILEVDSINRSGQWLTEQIVESIGAWNFLRITEYFGAAGFTERHIFGQHPDQWPIGDMYSFMYCYEEEDISLPVGEYYDCLLQLSGVEDELDIQNKIMIYPSPTKDFLTFSIPNLDKSNTLYIYNSIGSLIDTKILSPNNNELTIDLLNWSNGLYYWKIANQSGKFLKE